MLDGLHKLSTTPELGCPQAVTNQIAMLARRVRWGAPTEALDVLRVAERHGVPGFGRQRAMGLIAQGIATLHDVLGTAKDKLVQLLRSEPRAQALIDAVSSTVGLVPSRLAAAHHKTGQELASSARSRPATTVWAQTTKRQFLRSCGSRPLGLSQP